MARRKTALTIKPAVLKDCMARGSLDSVRIQDFKGGFRILISLDGAEKPLGLVKEDRERVFKKRATAEAHLAKLGVEGFSVDANIRLPQPKPTGGPGWTAPKKCRRDVTIHDADVHESIEEAFAQVDAGTAELIPLTSGFVEKVLMIVRAERLAKERQAALESDVRNGAHPARRDRQPAARKGRRTKALRTS